MDRALEVAARAGSTSCCRPVCVLAMPRQAYRRDRLRGVARRSGRPRPRLLHRRCRRRARTASSSSSHESSPRTSSPKSWSELDRHGAARHHRGAVRRVHADLEPLVRSTPPDDDEGHRRRSPPSRWRSRYPVEAWTWGNIDGRGRGAPVGKDRPAAHACSPASHPPRPTTTSSDGAISNTSSIDTAGPTTAASSTPTASLHRRVPA